MKSVRPTWLLLAVLLALSLAACGGATLPVDSTDTPSGTEAPDPTEAPEPTEAPPANEAPPATETPDDSGDETNWVFLIGLFLVAFLLVGMIIGRSRKKTPVPVAASTKKTFKDYARDGYSDARWLFDGLTDELAIWRGNALHEHRTATDDSAGTALMATWSQVDHRMSQATDQLYRAEAAAPDQNTAEMVRTTISTLGETRSAVDARAEARLSTRQTEATDQVALAKAAERERLASTKLTESRQKLNDALLALSALS
jgi:hypothetical protein